MDSDKTPYVFWTALGFLWVFSSSLHLVSAEAQDNFGLSLFWSVFLVFWSLYTTVGILLLLDTRKRENNG